MSTPERSIKPLHIGIGVGIIGVILFGLSLVVCVGAIWFANSRNNQVAKDRAQQEQTKIDSKLDKPNDKPVNQQSDNKQPIDSPVNLGSPKEEEFRDTRPYDASNHTLKTLFSLLEQQRTAWEHNSRLKGPTAFNQAGVVNSEYKRQIQEISEYKKLYEGWRRMFGGGASFDSGAVIAIQEWLAIEFQISREDALNMELYRVVNRINYKLKNVPFQLSVPLQTPILQ
jgi:hypothetical protein